MNPSLKILQKSCELYGYNFSEIDNVSSNLFQITDGNKYFFANNNKTEMFPINKYYSASILSDKAFCYQILKKHNFKTPNGKHFFLDNPLNTFILEGHKKHNINEYVKTLGFPVFVKPNNASLGRGAEVLYNTHDLTNHLSEIKHISNICLIQEFIRAPEYRIFVVEGKVEFIYKRNPISIGGDGIHTISQLLIQQGSHNFLKSVFFNKELFTRGMNFETILPKNTKIPLQAKTNISSGGNISDFSQTVDGKLQVWVKKIIDIFDIGVCGIDIFAPNGINSPEDFIIIELNSNPSLVGIYNLGQQQLVFDIWHKILNSYFGDKDINQNSQ